MDKSNIEFAVKAIILRNGKLLALHRKGVTDEWFDLPGGRMEYGETAEETVIREVKEETGLSVKPVRILDSWNNVKEEYQITGIFYLCILENGDDVNLSDEHDYYRWFEANRKSIVDLHYVFRSRMDKWKWEEMF
jgi:8-oxo-dGTP pyrophosphatase MutT (NUDIX family)